MASGLWKRTRRDYDSMYFSCTQTLVGTRGNRVSRTWNIPRNRSRCRCGDASCSKTPKRYGLKCEGTTKQLEEAEVAV